MLTRDRILSFLGGLAVGGLLAWLALSFPGGRGEGQRLDFSFREGQEYRVLRVVDGDTALIEPGMYLRYAGIDTPETRKFVKVEEPFGAEATEANRRLVEGRTVRLRFGARKMDGYGRVLACPEVRDPATGRWTPVDEELARQGLARLPFGSEPAPDRDRVTRAIEEARGAGRGLWAPAKDGK